MERAPFEVMMARTRARQFKALMAARGPAMHHRVGDVGMKLETESVTRPERLHREVASLGQQFGAAGQFESFTVPVVDLPRPVGSEVQPPRGGRDPLISDLGASFRV